MKMPKKEAFVLSGGEYDTNKRKYNPEAWDELANLVESITPPAFFS